MVANDAIGCHYERSLRTGIDTCSTFDTFAFILPDIFVLADSFRIVTPDTGERAAFEEHCCAYALAVVNRKSFYFKNQSLSPLHALSSQ